MCLDQFFQDNKYQKECHILSCNNLICHHLFRKSLHSILDVVRGKYHFHVQLHHKHNHQAISYLFQNNQSDLEFLLYRAKRIRYEVFVNDKTLFLKPARESDSVSMSLEYRVDIDDFSVKLSAQYEGSEFEVKGWDFKKKESLSAKAQKGNEISPMSAKESGMKMTESAFGSFSSALVDEYLVDTADAEQVAIARYNTQLVESVTGEGRCAGIPELRAGKTIEIKGVGRFSGTYYVTATTHTIDERGYYTSFKVRRAGV